MNKSKSLQNFFILSVLLIFILLDLNFKNINLNKSDYQFSWDEVDYAIAVNEGFYENAIELNTLHINDFFRVFLYKISNKEKFPKLSIEEILNSNVNEVSVFDSRHYHPPLMIYYLSLFNDPNPIINDKKIRIGFYLLSYLIIISILFVSFTKNNISFTNKLSLLLLLIIFFHSNIFQDSISRINFHIIFSFTLLFFIFSLINFIKIQNIKNIFLISFSSTLLLLSLESSIIIIFFSFVLLLFLKYKNKINILFTDFILLLILIFSFLFLLWPASIIKFSIIKSYSMYFYRLFFKNFDEYSNVNIFNNLFFLIQNNYFLILVSLFFLLISFTSISKFKINKLIILYLSSVYFVFILKVMINPTYVLPSLVLLILYLSFMIVNIKKLNFVILVFLFFTSIISAYTYINKNKSFHTPDYSINEIVYKINNLGKDSIILADGAHIFNYYSKFENILNLEIYTKDKPKFYTKINYKFYDLNDFINKALFDLIIIQKNRSFENQDISRFIKLGYKNIENNNYYFFQRNN
jgi:hypothetical protein